MVILTSSLIKIKLTVQSQAVFSNHFQDNKLVEQNYQKIKQASKLMMLLHLLFKPTPIRLEDDTKVSVMNAQINTEQCLHKLLI